MSSQNASWCVPGNDFTFLNTFDKFCFHNHYKHLYYCHIIKSNSEESGLNIFYLISDSLRFCAAFI